MNKKIYFEDKIIEFCDADVQTSNNQPVIFFDETDERKLNIFFDDLMSEDEEKMSETGQHFRMPSSNFKQVLDFLKNKYHYIEAAGGLIQKGKELLFIFRRGKWDLPKGKLDKGEKPEEAAIRECEEECGVEDLKIIQQLSSSFHLYKYKKSYALKQSFWYFMQTGFGGKLKPQTEEDIESAEWLGREEIEGKVFKNCYGTIKDVVNEAVELKFI